MEELQKAIKTARDVHDRSEELTRTSVALGALIRAVELLVEQLVKMGDASIRCTESITSLKEALCPELEQAVASVIHGKSSLPMSTCQEIGRSVIAELANIQVSIELPTDDELEKAHVAATVAACDSRAATGIKLTDIPRAGYRAIADLVSASFAPIVAAKDALILSQKREALHLESKLASAERSIEWHRQEATAASIGLGFSGSTIEEAVRKKNKAHDADKLRIVELEKSLEEATKVPVVDGKTPGQVHYYAELEKTYADSGAPFTLALAESGWNSKKDWQRKQVETGAHAVLRVFGNVANAKEVLQKQPKYERSWLSEQSDDKLFDLYMENVGFFDMNGTMLERENMIETLAAIDTELAKL